MKFMHGPLEVNYSELKNLEFESYWIWKLLNLKVIEFEEYWIKQFSKIIQYYWCDFVGGELFFGFFFNIAFK